MRHASKTLHIIVDDGDLRIPEDTVVGGPQLDQTEAIEVDTTRAKQKRIGVATIAVFAVELLDGAMDQQKNDERKR